MKYCQSSILFLSLVLLLSCSKERSLIEGGMVLRLSPALDPVTKSLTDNTNIAEKQIGFQITNIAGSLPYNNISLYNSLRLMKNGGTWKTDDGNNNIQEVTLTDNHAKIYAYYPFPGNLLDLSGTGETATLKMNIPQENPENTLSDYLWGSQSTNLPEGTNPINSSNSVVQIRMKHAMALLAFVIYKDGYSGSGSLTKIEIKSKTAQNVFRINQTEPNDLKMNLSNGNITGGKLVSQITLTNIQNTISLTANPGTDPAILFPLKNSYMLVAPASISNKSDLEFCFVIDGISFFTSLEGSELFNISAGNLYIFTAKLSPKMLNMTGVQEWTSVNQTNNSGYGF